MVGKFVFGMLSGGALVAGGFIISSAVFPLQPSVAANDPAPVAAAPVTADPVAADPAPEPEAQSESPPAPEVEPEAAAAPPETTTPPAPDSDPQPIAEAASPSEPVEPPGAEAAAPEAEAAAVTPAEPTLPAAEVAAAEEVSESPPVPEAAVEPTPAPEAEAPQPDPAPTDPAPTDPAPTATVDALDPPATLADTVVEAAPPVVAAVPTPELPPAPALPQLDADAVLAALDQSAAEGAPAAPAAAPTEAPVAEAPVPEAPIAEAPSDAPGTETAVDASPAPEAAPEPDIAAETAPEPVPDPVSDPAPGIAEVAPPVTPEAAPSADGMPAPALDDSDAARLPGTAAPEMPGIRPDTLPDTLPGTGDDADVAVLPEAAPEAETGPVFKPAPGLGDASEGVIVGRLPRIGDTPAPEAAPDTAEAEAVLPDDRPIAQFAATFENPDAKPVLAIVLIDPGTADLDRPGLAALPFPVSFALDPMDAATPERAAIYRAAGKEVVMLATGIAEGSQASDVEVAFQSMAQGLPEAVAVMDLAETVFQNRRPLASLVVPVVGGQGRGLLTWDQGLNAADQVARREDIAAAVVFRDLTSAGEDGTSIRRVLDRAVFKAGQDGRVAVAGTATPETVAALLEWTVEGRAATVAIAPLTAVMTVE